MTYAATGLAVALALATLGCNGHANAPEARPPFAGPSAGSAVPSPAPAPSAPPSQAASAIESVAPQRGDPAAAAPPELGLPIYPGSTIEAPLTSYVEIDGIGVRSAVLQSAESSARVLDYYRKHLQGLPGVLILTDASDVNGGSLVARDEAREVNLQVAVEARAQGSAIVLTRQAPARTR